MSIKYANNLDLQKNQLQNALLHILASEPGSPSEAQFIYDSTVKKLKFYNGTVWKALDEADGGPPTGSAGGDLTGTYPNPTLSGAVVDTIELVDNAVTLDKVSHPAANQVYVSDGSGVPLVVTQAAAFNKGFGSSAGTVCQGNDSRLHTQHTDTGTTGADFHIDSDNTGPRLKNAAGVLEVRNSADSAFADAKCKDLIVDGNLTVNGTQTILNVTTVEVDDDKILLLAGITGSISNANGGFQVKRFDSVETQRDVCVQWAEASTEFQAIGPNSADTGVVTRRLALNYAETIGNGVATSFNIDHAFNTKDVQVIVYEVSSGDDIRAGVTRPTVDRVTVDFSSAPSASQYRVVVVG